MKIFLMIGVLFAASTIYAQVSSEFFNERLRERTVAIDRNDRSNARYAYAMRNLFAKIIYFKKTYGLPDADISTIREIGLPQHGAEVNKPYFADLARRINGPDHVVGLASLLEQAREAETKANADYYWAAVSKLSEVGQDAINKAFIVEIENVKLSKTDYVGLASDAPQIMREWLRTMVGNYQRKYGNSGVTFPPSVNNDQSEEENSGEFGISRGRGQ